MQKAEDKEEIKQSIEDIVTDSEYEVPEEIVEQLHSLSEISSVNDIESQTIVNDGDVIETVEDAKKYLENSGQSINEEYYGLCKEIEEYKKDNSQDSCKEVVIDINNEVENSINEKNMTFGTIVKAAQVSYSAWTALTTQEKILIASDPKRALMSKSASETAFKWTKQKFGGNGLGDKSDGYRHGVWNAIMATDCGQWWAEAYATAHESGKTKKQLEKKAADGYKESRHRTMDLHNNKIGRSVVSWYETYWLSSKTIKSRISNKLTNKSSGIVWLHK